MQTVILFLCVSLFFQSEKCHAESSLEASNLEISKKITQIILSAFTPGERGMLEDHKFTTTGCVIPTLDWVRFIGFKQPINHEFKFEQGCDLNGKMVITAKPFNANLQIRNFMDYKKTEMKITPHFELNEQRQFIEIKLKSDSAKLYTLEAKPQVIFDFDYSSEFDIAGRGNNNEVLEINLKSIAGKKVSFKKKFKRPF